MVFAIQLTSLSAQTKAKVKSKSQKAVATTSTGIPTAFRFDAVTHDFGNVKQGEVVNKEFVFTNVGNKAIVIKNVTATCGCTIPSYPFIPINAGEKGTIGITFDSKHKLGNQNPTITVISNLGTFKLSMKGVVTD